MRLTYFLESDSFESEYSLLTLLCLAGFDAKKSKSSSAAHLIYGKSDKTDSQLLIRCTVEDVNIPIAKDISRNLDKTTLETDIIESVKLFLTDAVNGNATQKDFDTHDRLKFESSFSVKNEIGSVPLVNHYIHFLREWIERHLNISAMNYFPAGKKCIISLSHDVDRPVNNQLLRNFSFSKSWDIKQKVYHSLRYANALRHIKSGAADFNNHIEALLKLESAFGFRSTFFFCSSSMYSDYGSIYDVPYELEWNDVKSCIDNVREYGFEIGLHASYGSHGSADRFKREKVRLEEFSKITVAGLRHHYWHLGPAPFKTIEHHAEAGFKYDSSFAFNEHIGYRLNLAAGFYPMNEKKDSIINCMEIPAMCMDGNFDYSKPDYLKNIESTICDYINVLKNSGGVGVIDWHTDSSLPVNKRNIRASYVYRTILELLHNDNDVFVTNLGEVYKIYAPVLKNVSMLKRGPK